MRRPVVVWFVVAFGSLATVVNLLEAVAALAAAGQRPSEVIGHALITLAVLAASLVILALIVWVGFSTSLRSHLAVESAQPQR